MMYEKLYISPEWGVGIHVKCVFVLKRNGVIISRCDNCWTQFHGFFDRICSERHGGYTRRRTRARQQCVGVKARGWRRYEERRRITSSPEQCIQKYQSSKSARRSSYTRTVRTFSIQYFLTVVMVHVSLCRLNVLMYKNGSTFKCNYLYSNLHTGINIQLSTHKHWHWHWGQT